MIFQTTTKEMYVQQIFKWCKSEKNYAFSQAENVFLSV